MSRPEGSYEDLKSFAESLGVPWALAGALAAERYRLTARATKDADLLVSWKPGLDQLIERAGWEVRTASDPGDPPYLIRARRGEQYVDLLVALTDYQQVALERAKDNVLTVEDVLVHKIIAWRGRDRDDIESILAAGHDIDWAYVRHWVEYFGFEDRLDRLRAD